MITTATPSWRNGLLVFFGLAAGVFFWWQFHRENIWVGLPFGILGGFAVFLLLTLVVEFLLGGEGSKSQVVTDTSAVSR